MSNKTPKVRLQNLRDFTVQIRRPFDETIVGTGIAVSMDGQVVTCAHVVEAALRVHPRQADGVEVSVYFPQARGGEEKARRATVAGCFPQHDDDVVLLQLTGEAAPLAPEQIPVLGTAEMSDNHPFRSYGYRRLEKYIAGHAHGVILGCVECPEGFSLQADPVQLESKQINQGMSGAAVLDMERNLVVGIVSEFWLPPDYSPKDRDTAWAVNARVLTFDPLNLPLRDMPLPKRAAPQPKTDVEAARAAVAPDLGIAWNNAPAPLEEWVGREELLAAISRDWADAERRVTGLIGFGGEGKSSLARQSVETILRGDSPPPKSGEGLGPALPVPSIVEGSAVEGEGAKPDGVFWWGFYSRPSVDEFFEVALNYLSGGRIDPRKVPSASVRAQIIGAMLGAGRYLFILDGLEVIQHQEGDQYGLLKSAELREFLSYFAGPGHQSFCLITSRAPLLDLMDYTTYTHRDVTRLSPADGRDLLREVGVQGPDMALDQVVADWDGHALTLSLLGGYLAEQREGDVAHIGEIPAPTADEPHYERVHRVLRRYDEHLTEAERAFLTLFSAFRTPVHQSALYPVFYAEPDKSSEAVSFPLITSTVLDWTAFAIPERLVRCRLLRYNAETECYTTHPLIRNYYLTMLNGQDQAQVQAVHKRIKAYYLRREGSIELLSKGYIALLEDPALLKDYTDFASNYYPTLDDLAPAIEAVHHACRAGMYDEGFGIYRMCIDQLDLNIIETLGAYETILAIMLDFFPNGDMTEAPRVSDPEYRAIILGDIGKCLAAFGQSRQALQFYERAIEVTSGEDISYFYYNVAQLYIYLGDLTAGEEAIRQALEAAGYFREEANWQSLKASGYFIRHPDDAFDLFEVLSRDAKVSLNMRGWIAHLRGNLEEAGACLKMASMPLSDLEIYYFTHASRTHTRKPRAMDMTARDYAEYALHRHGPRHGSQRLRIYGDSEAALNRQDSAQQYYDEAVKMARSIFHRAVLIEGLQARGRWAARLAATLPQAWNLQAVDQALSDLNEALGYAVDGSYRIYEADIRVALAWAHLAAGDRQAARAEAERAQRMSADMGYHWGQVDAAEVLAAVRQH